MPKLKVSGMLAIALLLLTAHSFAAQWRIEVFDAGGGGKYPGLRIDSFGNIHASYFNEPLNELKYAFWDHRLNRLFTMPLDDRCNGFTSLALDSQQHPHI